MRYSKLALAALLVVAASSAQAQTYDAVADYNANLTTGTNPNGVWTYGWSFPSVTPLTLYTRHHIAFTDAGLVANAWDDPTHNTSFVPLVYKNTGTTTDDGNISIPADALILHGGGPNGSGGLENDYSHVIFTAPTAGTFTLTSSFQLDQRDGSSYDSIYINGVSVFSASLSTFQQSTSYTSTLSLLSGDTVDFAVRYLNITSNGNSTQLTATLAPAAPPSVPEPGSLALLVGMGISGSAFLARRRKQAPKGA